MAIEMPEYKLAEVRLSGQSGARVSETTDSGSKTKDEGMKIYDNKLKNV
jgi:hypothetical protein